MNEKINKMQELLLDARKYTMSPTAIENIDIVISMLDRVRGIVKMYNEEERV